MERGGNIESQAAIRVALIPVGDVPSSVFRDYSSIVLHHKKLELNNISSFYKEFQKSPFSHQPWQTGSITFDFIVEGFNRSPLEDFQAHRKVHGVIGICHCPHFPNLTEVYDEFRNLCNNYPSAKTNRCLAFDPDDSQVEQDDNKRKDLVLFPWANPEKLEFFMSTIIHDFAASMLMEFEMWVLRADEPQKNSFSTPLEPQSILTTEEAKKRRLGRIQKAIGDYCLLAGSPLDAHEHYKSAIDLAKLSTDNLWHAGALEGIASAIVLDAPERTPELEEAVRERYNEVIQLYHRIPAVSLEAEARLKLAKFLCRNELAAEVTQNLTNAVECLKTLPAMADKQILVTEVAQVFSKLGYHRKAAFFALQAAQLARKLETPDSAMCALQILYLTSPMYGVPFGLSKSRDSGDDQASLTKQSSPSCNWPSLQLFLLTSVLSAAQSAAEPIGAWAAAGALLRHHYALVKPSGQTALADVLKAAGERIPPGTRLRDPALPFLRLLAQPPPVPPSDIIQRTSLSADWWAKTQTTSSGPFIYTPFTSRDSSSASSAPKDLLWVVGQPCQVTVEVANPCSVPVHVDRITLAVSQPFQSLPRSFTVPQNTPSMKVALQGVPLVPGPVQVLGCLVTTWGVTVMHPFGAGVDWDVSRDPFRGWDGLQKRYVAPPATALVLNALPLLVGQLAEGERSGVLFEGEERVLAVTLTNAGTAPVASARLSLGAGRKGQGQVAAIEGAALQESLPLGVGRSVEVRVRVQAQARAGDSRTGRGPSRGPSRSVSDAKMVTMATLLVHYAGPECREEDLQLNPGRRLSLPLQVHVQPALQLVRAQLLAMGGASGMSERQLAYRDKLQSENESMSEPAGQELSDMAVREGRGLRLLELELWNGADVAFEVSAEVTGDGGGLVRRTKVERDCSALVLIPLEPFGTGAGDLAERVGDGAAKGSSEVSQFVLPRNEAAAREEARIQLAADTVCSRVRVTWRSGRSSGQLAIREAVKEALRGTGLEVLLPDLLTFRFSLGEPALGGEGPIVARQLTETLLTLSNSSDSPICATLSVTCRDAAGDSCMGGAETMGTVLFAGCVNGVQVTVPANGQASHKFSLCVLVPGEYTLVGAAIVEKYKPAGIEARLLDESYPSKICCTGLPHKLVVSSRLAMDDVDLDEQ